MPLHEALVICLYLFVVNDHNLKMTDHEMPIVKEHVYLVHSNSVSSAILIIRLIK